jgi:hypothetical protein
MNLLFQRVKLLFDVEVNICHVAAAFDYLSPQSLAALAVNPLVELCESTILLTPSSQQPCNLPEPFAIYP